MDLTVGSRHYHVSVLLLLGLALGLCWYFARDDGLSTALDHWLAAGRQEVQTAAKYRFDLRYLAGQRDVSLHREAALRRDSAQLYRNLQVAQHQVEGLVTSLDSVHREPLTPAVRQYAEACGEAINSCDERRALLAQALETEHARANLATQRAAHADSVIARGLQVTDCRWLMFRCPDRTVVAALGFMAGVLAAASVHH